MMRFAPTQAVVILLKIATLGAFFQMMTTPSLTHMLVSFASLWVVMLGSFCFHLENGNLDE